MLTEGGTSRMTEPVRLLAVSDSDEYARHVAGALEAEGIPAAVERVTSADDMRAALGRGGWDAAVSDVDVPGLGIEEVARLANRHGPDLPVIAVSRETDDETVDRALRAGAMELVSIEDPGCIACAVNRVVRGADARRDRLETEKSLREKDMLLRLVIANAPVIILATDAEGTISLFEGKGIEVFGLKHRDLLGMNIFRDMAMVCPGLAEDCGRALSGEEASRVHESPTGRRMDCRCLPMRDEGGRVTGMSCVATDITERVRMQEALKGSEARYRALVENTNDMAVSVDADGTVKYASPQARRLGLDPAEIVGRNVMDLVLPEDRERVAADFRRTMETGEESLVRGHREGPARF